MPCWLHTRNCMWGVEGWHSSRSTKLPDNRIIGHRVVQLLLLMQRFLGHLMNNLKINTEYQLFTLPGSWPYPWWQTFMHCFPSFFTVLILFHVHCRNGRQKKVTCLHRESSFIYWPRNARIRKLWFCFRQPNSCTIAVHYLLREPEIQIRPH